MGTAIFYPAVTGDDGGRQLPSGFSSGENLVSMGNQGGVIVGHGFVRFPSVTVPVGATISSAYVKFTAIGSNGNITVCNLNCHFNDADNAVAPTDLNEFDALSLTSAVAWDAVPVWVDDVQYDTPELKTILQGVIDRGGWASGQAVQIIVKDNESDSGAERRFSDMTYLAGAEKAELHIIWATPSTDTVATWNPLDAGSNISVDDTTLLTATHA